MARRSGRPSVTDVFGFLAPGKGKKVEYIELIYDLIFVYLIGRRWRAAFLRGGCTLRTSSLL